MDPRFLGDRRHPDAGGRPAGADRRRRIPRARAHGVGRRAVGAAQPDHAVHGDDGGGVRMRGVAAAQAGVRLARLTAQSRQAAAGDSADGRVLDRCGMAQLGVVPGDVRGVSAVRRALQPARRFPSAGRVRLPRRRDGLARRPVGLGPAHHRHAGQFSHSGRRAVGHRADHADHVRRVQPGLCAAGRAGGNPAGRAAGAPRGRGADRVARTGGPPAKPGRPRRQARVHAAGRAAGMVAGLVADRQRRHAAVLRHAGARQRLRPHVDHR